MTEQILDPAERVADKEFVDKMMARYRTMFTGAPNGPEPIVLDFDTWAFIFSNMCRVTTVQLDLFGQIESDLSSAERQQADWTAWLQDDRGRERTRVPQ